METMEKKVCLLGGNGEAEIMRNEICNHCQDKRGFCWVNCKKYREAQLKRAERRIVRKFGDDFDAEDRYTASLIVAAAITVMVILFALFCTVKVIGEWI